MDFPHSASPNWLSSTYLEGYPSRNLPTDFSDEAKKEIYRTQLLNVYFDRLSLIARVEDTWHSACLTLPNTGTWEQRWVHADQDDNTSAIQDAIEAAHSAGGGTALELTGME